MVVEGLDPLDFSGIPGYPNNYEDYTKVPWTE
jgi:hypothetical protein